MSFRDYFSDESAAYREARPTYPDALFAWVASESPARNMAWDCACGNGQATVPLARHFRHVIGTDASENQLAEAEKYPGVEYRLGRAEESGLDDQSVDCVTVAQAAHWFDHSAFHAEVRRVVRPGGLVALFSYGRHSVSPDIDSVMDHFYFDIVGPYWPPERKHVDQHYANLPFPFPRIEAPEFEMSLSWDLEHVLAYLGTWSATRAYQRALGSDPRERIAGNLATQWGDGQRRVSWPLTVLPGRV